MAHCVYSIEPEIDLLKHNEVFIAHCPASNMDLSSGIAPIRKYLHKHMKIGLGTDIAGGHSDSIFHAMVDAIVLDDSHLPHPQELAIYQRLERFAYLNRDEQGIAAKYVDGTKILS